MIGSVLFVLSIYRVPKGVVWRLRARMRAKGGDQAA